RTRRHAGAGGGRCLRSACATHRPDRAGGDGRCVLHPRRPDLQRPRNLADLRHPRVDGADVGGDPVALLRAAATPQPQGGVRMTRSLFRCTALAAITVLAVTACAPGTDQDAATERPLQAQGDPLPPPAPATATSATDPALDRAKAAAMAFSGQLRGKLQAAMQAGGPTAAVDVCHAE